MKLASHPSRIYVLFFLILVELAMYRSIYIKIVFQCIFVSPKNVPRHCVGERPEPCGWEVSTRSGKEVKGLGSAWISPKGASLNMLKYVFCWVYGDENTTVRVSYNKHIV
jgi:hypothetical protein